MTYDWTHRNLKEYNKAVSEARVLVVDGFDLAYVDGMEVLRETFENFDGGISENYVAGIKEAIRIFEKKNLPLT
jgi:hypothetical protein